MDNEDLNVAYGCLTAGSLALALYGTAYLGWKLYHTGAIDSFIGGK